MELVFLSTLFPPTFSVFLLSVRLPNTCVSTSMVSEQLSYHSD